MVDQFLEPVVFHWHRHHILTWKMFTIETSNASGIFFETCGMWKQPDINRNIFRRLTKAPH